GRSFSISGRPGLEQAARRPHLYTLKMMGTIYIPRQSNKADEQALIPTFMQGEIMRNALAQAITKRPALLGLAGLVFLAASPVLADNWTTGTGGQITSGTGTNPTVT